MRLHDDGLPEISRQIEHLADITQTIQRRLLYLVTQGTQSVIPPEDIVSELGTRRSWMQNPLAGNT